MKMLPTFYNFSVLEIIGILTLFFLFIFKPLRFVIDLLCEYCCGCFCGCASDKILKPGFRDYAVVTGATDGIGLEYARQLAQRGYNLLLISRSEEKLKGVKLELEANFVQCRRIEILVVDFSRTDIYDRIKLKLDFLDGHIHVLVNNVGMSPMSADYFHNHGSVDQFHQKQINCNVLSTTMMSEMVLQIILNQEYNPSQSPVRGVIINISSVFGLTECPLMATYSASKAYIRYFSNILSTEYAKDRILVQTVYPNQVDTKMMAKSGTVPLIVNALAYVRCALKAVGTEQQTSGHPWHKIVNGFLLFGRLFGHTLYMRVKLYASKFFV